MRLAHELAAGFGLLTRLPIGHLAPAGTDYARATWTYPVIGAAVGGWGAAIYAIATALGLAPALAAIWTLAALTLATGGLHEDGLADTTDGLGGRTRERRLEIMRDSRIGSYGAIALILSFAIRAVAVTTIAGPWHVAAALVVAGALGRAAILLVLARTRPARKDGLSATLATVPKGAVLAGLGLAIAVSFMLLSPRQALPACALAGLAGLMLARIATHRLGGHTGDILGATEIAAECLVLSLLTLP